MNAKHTPGPWRVGDAGRTVFGRNEGAVSPVTVATLPAVAHPSRIDERRANARLIASSPRLLAALEAMLEQADMGEIHDEETRAVVDEARLAVAEAKGLAR